MLLAESIETAADRASGTGQDQRKLLEIFGETKLGVGRRSNQAHRLTGQSVATKIRAGLGRPVCQHEVDVVTRETVEELLETAGDDAEPRVGGV